MNDHNENKSMISKDCTKIILISLLSPFIANYVFYYFNIIFQGSLYHLQTALVSISVFCLWILCAKYICKIKLIQTKPKRLLNDFCFIDGCLLIFLFISISMLIIWILNVIRIDILINLFYVESEVPAPHFLLTCVLVPIMEEIQYRYIGMNYLNKYGKFFSVVAVTTIFAFAHGFPSILIIFFPACALGIIYQMTNQLIWPIIYHILYNILTRNEIDFTGPIFIYWLLICVLCILGCIFLISKRKFFVKYRYSNIAPIIKDKKIYTQFFTSAGMIILYLVMFLNIFSAFMSRHS